MIELDRTELQIELPVGSSVCTPCVIIEPQGLPLQIPSMDMLASPEFNAVWRCIRSWDIGVPSVYVGHMCATPGHVRAILDAINSVAVIVSMKENPDAC